MRNVTSVDGGFLEYTMYISQKIGKYKQEQAVVIRRFLSRTPGYEAITIGDDTMDDNNKTLPKIIKVKCNI